MNILDLPIWLNGIVIVGGSAVLGVALVYGLDGLVKRRRGKKYSSVFSDGLQTVGTLYAVVAGFLIFGMYTTFDVSSQQSADEAAALVLMYRNAQAFPQPQRDQAQQAVVAYINSVITDEWPALGDRSDSPKTSKALNHMSDVYGPMEPDGRWSDQSHQVDRPSRYRRQAALRAHRPEQDCLAAHDLLVPAFCRRLHHDPLSVPSGGGE